MHFDGKFKIKMNSQQDFSQKAIMNIEYFLNSGHCEFKIVLI